VSNLLALRDGEAIDEMIDEMKDEMSVERNAELKQLETLRRTLNELPDIEPEAEVWEKIRARTIEQPGLAAEAKGAETTDRATTDTDTKAASLVAAGGMVIQAQGVFRAVRAPYAMAAGLLVAVMVGVLSVNVARETPPTVALAHNTTFETLLHRSQRLEPLAQRASFSGDNSAEQAVKFRIADLDSQIASYPGSTTLNQQEVQRLWSTRVALLESLAEGRRARAALQPAVF
jgi:hypothetical protein